MGLFSKRFSVKENKYKNHPEVLDRIARTLSVWALEQLRDDTRPQNKMQTWLKIECSWSIDLDNKPDDYARPPSWSTAYSLKWNDYGMEGVPEEDAQLFFDAFLPYLEKHIKEKVKQYIPDGIAIVNKTSYKRRHYRDSDEYDLIDAIEIHVLGTSKQVSSKSKYSSW